MIICPGLSEKSKRKKSDRAVSHNPVFVKTAQSVFGKNRDKPIKHTVRVRQSYFLVSLWSELSILSIEPQNTISPSGSNIIAKGKVNSPNVL